MTRFLRPVKTAAGKIQEVFLRQKFAVRLIGEQRD